MILVLVLPPALADIPASCVEPVSLAGFDARLDDAERAFAGLRVEAFGDTMDQVALELPCLAEPLTPLAAGRYHRLQGLRQFVAQNEERAVQSFAAARSADPEASFSEALLPSGHAVRQLYATYPLENGAYSAAWPAVEGELRFDGQVTLDRPSSWPTVFQVVDPRGQATTTAYLFPDDPLPRYDALVPEPPPVAALPWIHTRAQLRFSAASLGSGLAAGGLYAAALASRRTFDDLDHPDWGAEELRRQRGLTNGLVAASGVVGAVAVGTGVTAVFAGRW